MQDPQTHLDEQLSALMDGETSELELRRFFQQLEQMPAAQRQQYQARWERHQRLSAGLRGEPAVAVASSEFALRISSLVADEPAITADTAVEVPSKRSGANWAVAASVALAEAIDEGGHEVAAVFDLDLEVAFAGLGLSQRSQLVL